MSDYSPKRLRLLGDRAIGVICAPEVSRYIVMPTYFPSKTVRVINSNIAGIHVGDTIILHSSIPFDDYTSDVAGRRNLFTSTDIICKIVDDKPIPYGRYILLTDLGTTHSAGRVIPGGTRWAITHRYAAPDGTVYIAPNTAGLIVLYKGSEYRFFLEDDLLAVLEEGEVKDVRGE